MEEKQIVELFWSRSEEAISEITKKYGKLCGYIAKNILEDAIKAQSCVSQCYEILRESIPPHRPQNLKAYLCKIVRNHAMQMKCQSIAQREAELFQAELVIHDFLKHLEVEKRKVFVARYWFFAPVSEIAQHYKMSVVEVEECTHTIFQQLNQKLTHKKLFLQVEELLYAMTEIEDSYLEEVATSKETGNREKKWYSISAVAAVLVLLLAISILPQTLGKQDINGTESESESGQTETGAQPQFDPEKYIDVVYGDVMSREDFSLQTENLPWNPNMTTAALPIYKNLAKSYDSGECVYLDEDTLLTIAEDVASKLKMNIVETSYASVIDRLDATICGIVATTDLGTIEIDGRGEVYVHFKESQSLPSGYAASNSISKEEADRTVDHLISYYKNAFLWEDLSADSYAVYDLNENRQMIYRAVGTRGPYNDVEEYYLHQVYFYFDDQQRLTGFRFYDYRTATELVSYYPLISYWEAKKCLENGEYLSNQYGMFLEYREGTIERTELMYRISDGEEYYQPYYCFYIYLEKFGQYNTFYVPAAKGAKINEVPPEPEIKILDVEGYEFSAKSFVYRKDWKYYTVENGMLVEGNKDELLAHESTGEIWVENGMRYFHYGDSIVVNLDEILSDVYFGYYSDLSASYIEGKIIIHASTQKREDTESLEACYVYSVEDKTITKITEANYLSYADLYRWGIRLYGRYGIKGNTYGDMQIIDAVEGNIYNTEIQLKEVEMIYNASEQHFAVLYKNGEIQIVEKISGKTIKETKEKINFVTSNMMYKDGLLYIESTNGRPLIFVISEFADIA